MTDFCAVAAGVCSMWCLTLAEACFLGLTKDKWSITGSKTSTAQLQERSTRRESSQTAMFKSKQKLWMQHLLVLLTLRILFFWDNASAELVVEVDGLVQTNCLIPLETNKMNAGKRGFLFEINEFSWISMSKFRGVLQFWNSPLSWYIAPIFILWFFFTKRKKNKTSFCTKFHFSYVYEFSFVGILNLVVRFFSPPLYLGVSLNGGTPHFTPQNDHVSSEKPHGCVGETHHF